MVTTKKIDLINSSFSLLRISGLTVQPTPEDVNVALWRMEDMLSEWESRTVDINYQFEDAPDPNTESGVDRKYHNAVSSNLADRLAIDYGKDTDPKLSAQATQSYTALSAIIARERLNQVQYPNRMPRGAGHRVFNRYRRYFPQIAVNQTSANNETIFVGDIDDYVADFTSYLSTAGGTITSYTIKAHDALNIVSDSINADLNAIDYRVEGIRLQVAATVTIAVTTSTGRVQTIERVFTVVESVNN